MKGNTAQQAQQSTRTTIIQLLSQLGSEREIRLYLERFSDLERSRFAVIKVGGAILRDELDALASSLAFLYRVGLVPIVIHGGGPQLDQALQSADIASQRHNGLRITTPDVLRVARQVFRDINQELVQALQKLGVAAHGIVNGIFVAKHSDVQQLGLVGHVNSIDDHSIMNALNSNCIPVLATLGETETGQILNINADEAAQHLVRHFLPYKVIFLTGPGGILDAEQDIIPSINLSSDYDDLMAQPWLHSGMQLKLQQIHDLLQDLPRSVSVSITSPEALPKELFTHRGSGTLVRMGESIEVHTHWDSVDQEQLQALLESSFGGELSNDYFNKTTLLAAYISKSYRSAAVITYEQGFAKLDKFAVTDTARGEGLGRAVWNVMHTQHPTLFWRAKRHNPINGFYIRHADGMLKGPQWHMFWCGNIPPKALSELFQYLQNSPATITRCLDHAE